MPVEYKYRDCVSNWLLTLLMDEKSTPTTDEEFPIITKKIRDEVLGESKVSYFQRSSIYMSIKTLLQHSLTMHLGSEAGKILFKIVMLKFLVSTCTPYKNSTSFDIDLMSQMIAKLATRCEKLSKTMITDDTNNLYDRVIDEAKKTIDTICKKINIQILSIHRKDDAKLSPLTGLNFETDIVYKMPTLDQYLKDRRSQNIQETNNNSKRPTFNKYERYFKSHRPNIDPHKSKPELEKRIFWLDFERMVLYEMKIEDDHWTSDQLRSWSFAYATYAEAHYKNNQLFISQMLLVRLKLIMILDKKAIEEYPLLKEHKSGINEYIIDHLLLPHRTDMCIAFEIENYFRERNRQANDPSIFGEQEISRRSFSVKYARDNACMDQVRMDIFKEDKENENAKKRQWEEGRKKAEELKSKARCMQHTSDTDSNGYEYHPEWCSRCLLERQANSERIMEYEHLLPEDENEQFAIVFELNIPKAIASLRDVLYGFAEFCYGPSEKLEIKVKWNTNLSKYDKSDSKYVTLASTKMHELKNHPVCCAFEEFLVKNPFNGILNSNNKATPVEDPAMDLVKNMCTFKTQDEYIGLQRTLNSTHHTENEVLSSQSKCGTDLTSTEYKNFGLLRADGHRLQIRKLYAMIETGALSFEKESVLSLIMQTLWECEVSGTAKSIRESHTDFADAKFCNSMITLLEKFIDQHRNNWVHPLKLLTATLIAIRAFEINSTDELATKIAKILSKIRTIALDWIGQIEIAIRDMPNPDEETERNLRLKLIYVTIIGGLTYFVHPKHPYFERIFQTNQEGDMTVTAMRSWLRFIISLKNNVCMYTNDEQQLPSNLRMFLRLMENVGISLENDIRKVANEEIKTLIQKHWTRAKNETFDRIYFDEEFPHISVADITLNSTIQNVTIDIITGSFLVDGLPLSRLPSKIMNEKIYRWFFGDVGFEVQPDAQGNFSTIHDYNDCTYEFKMVNEKVIIMEKKVNVFEKELIDQKNFIGDFPYYLVNKYSHWWNKGEKSIEFRQKPVGGIHFSKETTIDYRLDLDNRRLIHVQTQRPMLDIKSDGFRKISEHLLRLEHPKYIHVLLKSEHVAIAELLRMNLKFTVSCDGNSNLMSNEFNGMHVSHSQKIGTLCGLNHGLILESIADDRQILLIPNGNIKIEKVNNFVSVWIDTEKDLQSPPFYQYHVDKFCRQLKSSNVSHASWFYLAYLHAITSHGEIEPFTGISGTERALQILQSAFSWSSSPYEPEAVQILSRIADLTPLRKLQKNMQLVEWPKNIPSRSAQDCFVFIATKLLEDSQRLRSLHDQNENSKIKLDTDLKLNERDHRRCQQLNPNLHVLDAFINHKVLKTSSPIFNASAFSKDTRTVCTLYHRQRFLIPANCNLKQFLYGGESLQGLGNKHRIKDLLSHCFHEKLHQLWISLYDIAIQQKLNSEQFAVILSFYAHRGENIEPILALQAIATSPNVFQHIKPPPFKSYEVSAGADYKSEDVAKIVKTFYTQPTKYHSKDWADSGKKLTHDLTLIAVIFDVTETIKQNWPCDSFEFLQKWSIGFEYINYVKANAAVDAKLKIWHANHELKVFMKRVETQLQSLVPKNLGSLSMNPCLLPQSTAPNWSKTTIDFEAKIRKNSEKFKQKIEEAKNVWEKKIDSNLSAQEWWEIFKTVCYSEETHYHIQAGTFPRMVPCLFLPKIMDPQFHYGLKCLIGAFAIALAREQRENRMQAYSQRSDRQAALDRERKNEPYTNWSPCDYPEWLLFEIEQNLTIRRIQIEIAKRMIEPPEINTKNSVMQLNMGEGKTAVIVPILGK